MSAEELVTPAAADTETARTVAAQVSTPGNASVTASLAGFVSAQGDATVYQSAATVVVAQDNADIDQSAVCALVTRTMTGERVYTAAAVSGEMSVSRSWVVVALTPRLSVSEDSKVIIGPVGALIIAAAIFGVFGIVTVLGYYAARRAMQWRPKVPVLEWHRMGE